MRRQTIPQNKNRGKKN